MCKKSKNHDRFEREIMCCFARDGRTQLAVVVFFRNRFHCENTAKFWSCVVFRPAVSTRPAGGRRQKILLIVAENSLILFKLGGGNGSETCVVSRRKEHLLAPCSFRCRSVPPPFIEIKGRHGITKMCCFQVQHPVQVQYKSNRDPMQAQQRSNTERRGSGFRV